MAQSNFCGTGAQKVSIGGFGSTNVDAFGRLVAVSPQHIIDLTQATNPMFNFYYDDQEVSGSGTSSTHNVDEAAVQLAVSATTAGKRVRQTYQAVHYQAGRGIEILMTGTTFACQPGVTKELGVQSDTDGAFFRFTQERFYAVIKRNVTGTPTEIAIPMEQFSESPIAGTQYDNSLYTSTDGLEPGRVGLANPPDPSKIQLWYIRYGWQGASSVTFGVVINSQKHDLHIENFGNAQGAVQWSTPSLPIRFSIESDGTNPSDDFLDTVCVSASALGGIAVSGTPRIVTNGGGNEEAEINTDDPKAVVSIRIGASYKGATAFLRRVILACTTNTNAYWGIAVNASVAGTASWVSVGPTSSLEFDRGRENELVTYTDDQVIMAGWINTTSDFVASDFTPNTRTLGFAIDGTPDVYTLFVWKTNNSTEDFHYIVELGELL